MPEVSIIIPVYNDAERLATCLAALAKQTFSPERFEVIVVDNGSDEPPESLVAEYPFAQLAHEAKPGSYAARNRGLAIAQGPTLAFTDADCVPDPVWLEEGVAALAADAPEGMVGGRVELFAAEDRPNAVELFDFVFGFHQETNVVEHRYAATANMFTTRAVFDAVGPFNDEMKSSGDLEWGNRVAQAGRTLAYSHAALVRHPARHTLAALTTKARRHTGGRYDLKDKANQPRRLSLRYVGVVLRTVLPNFRRMRRARRGLRERGYGWGEWLRVCWVILVVQYATLIEFFRVRLRGKTERR